MNAKTQARIDAAELAAIQQLTDEELDALIAEFDSKSDYSWVGELSDAELDSMLAGGPRPVRFAAA